MLNWLPAVGDTTELIGKSQVRIICFINTNLLLSLPAVCFRMVVALGAVADLQLTIETPVSRAHQEVRDSTV